MFLFFQFKRHKSKKHTRNFAKSVVNLVDAVSYIIIATILKHAFYFNTKTKPILSIVYYILDYPFYPLMLFIICQHPQIFKEQLNTRVVLVAVEIWTDRDRIPLSVKPLDMLKDFSKYRQQNIGVSADAVHLFT